MVLELVDLVAYVTSALVASIIFSLMLGAVTGCLGSAVLVLPAVPDNDRM